MSPLRYWRFRTGAIPWDAVQLVTRRVGTSRLAPLPETLGPWGGVQGEYCALVQGSIFRRNWGWW
jgi:hypothetical protein